MKSLERLMRALKALPGIGPRQAERLSIFLLRSRRAAEELGAALEEARRTMRVCSECWNFAERSPCRICSDSGRDQGLICVVSEPQDAAAIERSGYRGLYHVLHGSISPLDGVGPERLKINELEARVKRGRGVLRELILATNPDAEGEATALYLLELLRALGPFKVTRIAQGVPLGGAIDYLDEKTLAMALSGRRELE